MVPKTIPRCRLPGLWDVISSFGNVSKARGEIFEEEVGFKVGEGDRVPFWFDDWMGVGLLVY